MITVRWGDDMFISGGTIPGIPTWTYARSKYAGWGVTALNPDCSDLYVEKVDGDKYFYDGQWHQFKSIKETFKIKFGADQYYTYNFTHNGVMLYVPDVDKMDFAIWEPLEFLD
jgi:penicillin amidase